MGANAGKRRITIWLTCLLFCLPLLMQWAQPISASDLSYKTVRVGYYRSDKFQEGDGQNEHRSGYGYEYLQKIASYTGWKYEYVAGDWSDLYQKLKDGEIDLMAGVSYNDTRSTEVLFSDYEMLQETFYIYKDVDDGSMQSGDIASYAGKRIGVVNDAKMKNCLNDWIALTNAAVQTVQFEDLEACAEAFNRRELDGFVSADNIVSGYTGINPVEMLGRVPYYICVTNNRPDLLSDLNAALALINGQDSAYLVSLKTKYTADTSISIFLSQQEREWLETHPQVKVGYLDQYMPYCSTDSDGTADGLLSDTLRDLFATLPGGYQPELSYTAYASHEDMIKALKANEVDLIFPVSSELPYAERNGYQQSSVITHAAVDLVYIDSYNEEKFSRIAVNQNNQLQCEYVEMNYPDAELVYCDSARDCISAIRRGEADSTVFEALRAVEIAGAYTDLQLVPLQSTCDFCFGVNYGNSALLRILNHGLSMLGDGYGLSHAYQYIGDVVTGSVHDSIRKYAWIFGGLAIFCLLLVLWQRYRSMRRLSEEETRHNLALQDALLRAHQAGYAKRVFLNNISHDLRTPLNAILGIMEINRKSTDAAVIADNRRKMQQAADQLVTMTDHMIEVSKLESGDILNMREEVDLAAVLLDTETTIKHRAEQEGLHFVHESSSAVADWPHVYGNTVCMQELFQHILDNAVKYNRPNGKVIWQDSLTHENDTTVAYSCTITDTGIGMKPEFLKHVFEPFAQERYDARTSYRGSGLGMAITKNLINQMNGTIDISSSENVGTTVRIRILMELCPKQVENVPQTAPSEQEPQTADLSGLHILLVEDNELNIEISRFLLEDAGAQVSVARDGKQAVEMYQNAPEGAFDAVLMDIMMPVMNGYEAARLIRASARQDAKTLPIIATTACVEEDVKQECRKVGIDAYLPKPLDMPKLMQTILQLVRK